MYIHFTHSWIFTLRCCCRRSSTHCSHLFYRKLIKCPLCLFKQQTFFRPSILVFTRCMCCCERKNLNNTTSIWPFFSPTKILQTPSKREWSSSGWRGMRRAICYMTINKAENEPWFEDVIVAKALVVLSSNGNRQHRLGCTKQQPVHLSSMR